MKKIGCPLCEENFTSPEGLFEHVEEEHRDEIPEDFTADQYVYFVRTGRDHGNCVVCKGATNWNPKTHKYARFCSKKSCKEKYINTFKSRMISKYGKTTLLNDPTQQKKMLAHRKISGEYKWSDGTKKVYTGSYELDFLKFLDVFMGYDSSDVMTPSPHTYYYIYEGEKKFYIPDAYIPSLNLEIEIKDGGDNPNKHHKIVSVDKEKERLKDEVMYSLKDRRYIKIVNKNYDGFFKFLQDEKENFLNAKSVNIGRVVQEATEFIENNTFSPLNEFTDTIDISDVLKEDYQITNLPDYSIHDDEGFYSKDGKCWNSVISYNGKKYRHKVETIVFDNENKIYMRIKNNECIFPGGSTEKDVPNIVQAENEVKEEARIKIKDIKYTGVNYIKNVDFNIEGHDYDGCYIEVYIAKYNGDFIGYIAPTDRDDDMYRHGNFYKFDDVADLLYGVHKNIILKELTDRFVTEANVRKTELINSDLQPVYISLFSNDTDFGKMIRKVTGSDYSHATISLDPSMNEMYSFSDIPYSKLSFTGAGFVRESLWSPQYRKNKFFTIMVTFVSAEQKEIIRQKINYFIEHYREFKYNDIGLVQYYLHFKNRNKHDEKKKKFWFCSEFVSAMLDAADIKGFENILMSPQDIRNRECDYVFKCDDYTLKTFSEKKLIKRTEELKKQYISEASRNPVSESYTNIDLEPVEEFNFKSLLKFKNKEPYDEKEVGAYTSLVDWKKLYIEYIKRFDKAYSEIRFDLFELIIRKYLLIFKKDASKVTEYIIGEMDRICNKLKATAITAVDVAGAKIQVVSNNVVKHFHYPDLNKTDK